MMQRGVSQKFIEPKETYDDVVFTQRNSMIRHVHHPEEHSSADTLPLRCENVDDEYSACNQMRKTAISKLDRQIDMKKQ